MNFDELSRRYDGIIPFTEKEWTRAGGYEAYYVAFLRASERNFASRCAQAVRSIAAWRILDRYDGAIAEMMLNRLQRVLYSSRGSAIKALGGLSKVAVKAAPISTA